MTADVRTLLHDTAEAPSRGPDLEGAMRSGRDRRRRRRGLGALVAVVVVALVGGVFVATSGDGGEDARVAIGPRQTESSVPDGWKTISVDPGITISIPPGWNTYDPVDTPDGGVSRVVAGTYAPLPADGPNPCFVVPDGEGAWVRLWEFPAGTTEVAEPFGRTMPVSSRSEAFRPYSPVAAQSGCSGDIGFTHFAFVDGGRVFLAEVMSNVVTSPVIQARIDNLTAEINGLTAQISVHPPNEATLAAQLRALQNQLQITYDQLGLDDATNLGREVLDTLRVEPLDPSAPTTVPDVSAPTTTLPLPIATTLPPFIGATEDEQLIQKLFESWLRHHPDDDTRLMVEDADALMESIHEGLAQHTAEDLALYSGTVSGIRMLDADHAEVQYTLLHDGRPQFGLRTGTAVRIDGRWMVSRATECALLSLGGITCPPE